MSTEIGRTKVARSVAQFANADGGLIVIGFQTKSKDGIDTVHAVTPPAPLNAVRQKYLQALKNHLYPPPERLTVEVHAVTGATGPGEIVLISVPARPLELQPFLVHGVAIEGRMHAAHVMIVERHDDEGQPTSV